MLWFMCFCLLALSSAFPFENYKVQLVSYRELPYQRHAICLPSPFRTQICLPSSFQFFIPLRTEQQRCVSIPIMRAYVLKVCPSTESISNGENLSKSLKETVKEVITEPEEERLSDNTNTEVNGGEVEPEKETKESKVEDKNIESENKIVSQQVSDNEYLEEQTIDENISITSNLV